MKLRIWLCCIRTTQRPSSVKRPSCVQSNVYSMPRNFNRALSRELEAITHFPGFCPSGLHVIKIIFGLFFLTAYFNSLRLTSDMTLAQSLCQLSAVTTSPSSRHSFSYMYLSRAPPACITAHNLPPLLLHHHYFYPNLHLHISNV